MPAKPYYHGMLRNPTTMACCKVLCHGMVKNATSATMENYKTLLPSHATKPFLPRHTAKPYQPGLVQRVFEDFRHFHAIKISCLSYKNSVCQKYNIRENEVCHLVQPNTPTPTSIVCRVILPVKVLLSVYVHFLVLSLVIINSKSTHLVWLPRYQWYTGYKIYRFNTVLNSDLDLAKSNLIFTQNTPACDDVPSN